MRVPGYIWRPVVGIERDPVIDVVHGLILHVTGTMESPFNFFNGPSRGIESHLYCPRNKDDERQQYRDTTREADANFLANSWIVNGKRHGFVSMENMGRAAGTWTNFQVSEIKRVGLLLHKEHGFPLQVPKSPKGKGIGFHTQFSDWSNVAGKVCPGDERKQQYWDIIVPWMKEVTAAENQRWYEVKQGESIIDVAEKFDVTVAQLWRLNDIGDFLPLNAGRKVRIR